MNRKKIDNRIRVLIENGVQTKKRSMFFIVGDQCCNQIPILYDMLNRDAQIARQDVLWCYKKSLGFSNNRKHKKKRIEKHAKNGTLDLNNPDPFELFVASTKVRYCYYNETHKILGNTFGMCVLQDFEGLTPNLLARTIETVSGSGIICFLLKSMDSVRKIYSLTMDVHARYRTESHTDVKGRFNERFLLSLADCDNCLVLRDNLQVLPIFSHLKNIEPLPPKTAAEIRSKNEEKLMQLKEKLQNNGPVHAIVNCCKTFDQGAALVNLIEKFTQKSTWNETVSITAARGRGKSATLGLAIASAVTYQYPNIFITAPSPENLKTVFEFVLKGFDALQYQQTLDYELVQSTNPEFNKAVVRINIHREHRQTIQYIHPTDAAKLSNCELLVIDEAAAIPLPLVQKLLGCHDNGCRYLTFMSSTINGYEGTGRSLSLKLLKDLKVKSSTPNGRKLTELELHESVRYAPGDPIEAWLNKLLCLECVTSFNSYKAGFYPPEKCELFYVDRDTLFSYNKASESFLQTLMSLYVSSHYKNSPNDLQMLSDAPAHHIFCLAPPVSAQQDKLPEVLCVIQVCLEGRISKASVEGKVKRGKRAAGDLIPWTVTDQFQNYDFPQLCGARIVRIATHPDYQGMGYGKQALKMLVKYYEGEIVGLDEDVMESSPSVDIAESLDGEVDLTNEVIAPRPELVLLKKLTERRAEKLDWLGVSYGATQQLFRFWQNGGFRPVYLCQRPNDLTGEHSCVMVRALQSSEFEQKWLDFFFQDFSRRFIQLLGYEFSAFKPTMALQILRKKKVAAEQRKQLTKTELDLHLTPKDLQRLEKYAQDACVYRLILDLMPTLAKLFFSDKLPIELMEGQKTVLLAIGLQHKSVSDIATSINLTDSEVLTQLKRLVRKISNHLNKVFEQGLAEEECLPSSDAADRVKLNPIEQDLQEELQEAAKEDEEKRRNLESLLSNTDLKQYQIAGDSESWDKALSSGKKMNMVSVKSNKKAGKRAASEVVQKETNGEVKKKKKKKMGGANKGKKMMKS